MLDIECRQMLEILREKHIDMLEELKADSRNTRLIVETGFVKDICEDIEFLDNLQLKYRRGRYFNLVLRNCMEQLIILSFLKEESREKEDIFEDYLGMNIDNNSIEEEKDKFKALKMLGGERSSSYKNKFYKMAERFEDVEDETSVYKLYGTLADDCHNSYYHDITKEITGDNDYDEKSTSAIMIFLLTKLYEIIERY